MEAARSVLELRIRELAGVRLGDLLTRDGPLATLSPAVERAARDGRSALADELGDDRTRRKVAGFLARKTRALALGENPFLELEPAHERVIEAVHAALLKDVAGALASRHASGEWAEVAEALRRAIVRARGAPARARRGAPPRGGRSARRPRARLRGVLARAPAPRARRALRGAPRALLDLGCGAKGALVLYLRRAGLAPVVGVDRAAPAGPGFYRESWFTADLARHAWRTVIAHQSFSLHFLHAHVHSEERAARFAQRYLEILRSLAPGGRFVYAPALPFLEALLPGAEFVATTRPIAGTELLAASVERRA